MSNSGMLTCRELVELVTDYIEGALPPDQQARFEQHLAMCNGCRTYIDQMRTTIMLTGTLVEEHVSPAARRDLLEAFRTWKNSAS